MSKYLTVVIVAAGSSTRLNNKIPKPYIKINGKPILWYSTNIFNKINFVKDIFIVISEKDIDYAKKFRNKYLKKMTKFNNFIFGGKERSDSVFNSLKYMQTNYIKCDYIAIHDAARPFIRESVIMEIWKNALQHDAAAPGIIPVDTIKICNENFITLHPKRTSLIAIQTPQIFKYKKILEAYNESYRDGIMFTDDTEIYGKIYDKIKIVDGDIDLIKITHKKDLATAKQILSNNKELC